LLSMLQGMNDEVSTLMFFGHNPLVSDLTRFFMQSSSLYEMPTCGMACFESYASSWELVDPRNSMLRWLLIPRLRRKPASADTEEDTEDEATE